MKKSKNDVSLLNVTATIDDFPFLEKVVEKLSYRRPENSYVAELVTPDQQTIDPSSLEAYISGSFSFSHNDQPVHTPFISCFLFTCIRGEEGNDKLVWSVSLS